MLQDQELEEAIADAVDIGEKEVLGGKGIFVANIMVCQIQWTYIIKFVYH